MEAKPGFLIALCAILFLAACGRDKAAPPPPDLNPPASPDAAAPTPAGEAGEAGDQAARAFVSRFMDSRLSGDTGQAREYLSPTARRQYGDGEGGLALTATASPRFAGWEVTSFEAADASSFEVRVRIREERPGGAPGSTFEEVLFVGPGPDWRGTPRPWIVRGAQREVASGG